MKPNLFQKITILMYISIVILIFIYFVPYHGVYNAFSPMEGSYKVNKSYHSNILDEGYGAISYFRFLFYLIIPGFIFYFLFIYLERMNLLEIKTYKEKARKELYVFFVFILIIVGTVVYLYGKNEFVEIKKDNLSNEIFDIKKSIKQVDEDQNYKHKIYLLINDYRFTGYLWDENVFDSYLENDKGFLNSIYNFLKENKEIENVTESTFNSRMRIKTPYEVSILEKKRIELEKKLDDKLKDLKNLNFYSNSVINFNIISSFLTSFLLLYVLRPLFYFFKGMVKEVS